MKSIRELRQEINRAIPSMHRQRSSSVGMLFIVGVSRSGTTLLRKTLNRSDSIAISNENHFWDILLSREGVRFKFRQFGESAPG